VHSASRLRRDGVGRVVRAHRYALAVALGGRELPATEMAPHECDNPLCVRVVDPATAGAGTALHVVTGTQAQNMQRMGRRGRGGGQTTDPDAGRVAGGAGAPVPGAAQRMGR
jgi:hypothetical protein